MKNVRVGIIGFGGRGGGVAHEGEGTTGGLMRIAAAVDPSDMRFERGCKAWNCAPKRYATGREMMAVTKCYFPAKRLPTCSRRSAILANLSWYRRSTA